MRDGKKKKYPARQISDTKLDGINWNKKKSSTSTRRCSNWSIVNYSCEGNTYGDIKGFVES